MTYNKGQKREREAADLFEDAGYWTYRPERAQYGDNDMWGLFDVGAVGDGRLYLAQVKANRSDGIQQWCEDCAPFHRIEGIICLFMVCHDRAGWRLAVTPDIMHDGYAWVVDERDRDCSMGEGVVEWLRGSKD